MNNAVFECQASNEKGQSQPAAISLDVLCEYFKFQFIIMIIIIFVFEFQR